MTATPPLLSVAGLAKRYGEQKVLDDVHFDVMPGEILGVIGPNGAGKTKLMECVAGLLPADAGEIRFRGGSQKRLAKASLLIGLRAVGFKVRPMRSPRPA